MNDLRKDQIKRAFVELRALGYDAKLRDVAFGLIDAPQLMPKNIDFGGVIYVDHTGTKDQIEKAVRTLRVYGLLADWSGFTGSAISIAQHAPFGERPCRNNLGKHGHTVTHTSKLGIESCFRFYESFDTVTRAVENMNANHRRKVQRDYKLRRSILDSRS